jgi:hypothetical protein
VIPKARAIGEILRVRAFLCVVLLLAACEGEPPRPHRHAAVVRLELPWETGRALRAWRPASVPDSTLLPLLLFSPGLGQVPAAYDSLLTHVAAGGFVVVGVPLARYDTTFGFFSNLARFTRNVSGALDRVLADTIVAMVDTARIGAFGHSYGGAISAELCHRDGRVKAGMNMDGSVFGLSVTRGGACPFLLLMAELPWIDRTFGRPKFYQDRDQGRLHEEMMFERSRRMWWLTFEGLDHMAFTDAAYSTRVHEAAGRYASAFFDYTLKDALQPEELQRSPYPFASLRSRP